MIHFETSGDAYFELKAKFYDTEFTATWTGKAEQEKQTIGISSTVVHDVQVILMFLYFYRNLSCFIC